MNFREFILSVICFSLMLAVLSQCTDNQRAKSWGGSKVVNLDPGQKLVNATWKDEDDLWFLTRSMKDGETADTIHFHQDKGKAFSLFGGGEVVFIEQKK